MDSISIIQDNPQLIRLDIRINGMRRVKEVLRERKKNIERNNKYNKKG